MNTIAQKLIVEAMLDAHFKGVDMPTLEDVNNIVEDVDGHPYVKGLDSPHETGLKSELRKLADTLTVIVGNLRRMAE